jgi:hypothetical protein
LTGTFVLGVRVPPQSTQPKITIFRLDDYGRQPSPILQHGEWPGTPSQVVSFDHAGRVLVGFTTREGFGLATREHPKLALHILRFSAEGKIEFNLALPTDNHSTDGFYLGAKDQIIVRANNSIQVQAEEGDIHSGVTTWRSLAPCSMNCRIYQSPSHRTLIIRESYDGLGHSSRWPTNDSTYTVIDTSSEPHVLRTCSQMAHWGEKITDDFAYWPKLEGRDEVTLRFPICDVDHSEQLPWKWYGGFFPFNNDEFLLLGGEGKKSRGEIKLVRSDGTVKFRRETPKHETPQYEAGFWAISDESGDRLAFIAETWHGGSRALDASGKRVARRIVIYSDSGEQLSSVSVSPMSNRDLDFALSPNGHRLGILESGLLKVVDIE